MQYFNMDTRYGTYSDKLEPCIIHIIQEEKIKSVANLFDGKLNKVLRYLLGDEYANLFHEAYLAQIQERPWLVYTAAWLLYDFAVSNRNEGGTPFLNDKGLITRDRQTKKDIYYLYQAAWSDQPVCYITSRRFRLRLL